MRQIQRRRMKLSRTTVRSLNGEHLGRANGGTETFVKSNFYECNGTHVDCESVERCAEVTNLCRDDNSEQCY